MKSSSQLFPVSLLRADVYGDQSEDIYLVKHNLDADRSVQIAVAHLGLEDKTPSRGPVIMVHGSFTNRGFWLSTKGEGLARYLLDQGFDVWLMEHRGHGLSPRNQDYYNNTAERYVLHDVAAVNAFVQEKTGTAPQWVGHSLGGVLIASAVAAGILNADNCRSMVLLGTQAISRPWYLWIPFVGSVMRGLVFVRKELNGRKLGIGPENEPAALLNEYLASRGWFGAWQLKSTQQKLLPLWKTGSGIPLLALVGAADKSDSPRSCKKFAALYGGEQKEVLVLGKAEGFSQNYGHIDMIVSKEAAAEVWPKIGDWLGAKAS